MGERGSRRAKMEHSKLIHISHKLRKVNSRFAKMKVTVGKIAHNLHEVESSINHKKQVLQKMRLERMHLQEELAHWRSVFLHKSEINTQGEAKFSKESKVMLNE